MLDTRENILFSCASRIEIHIMQVHIYMYKYATLIDFWNNNIRKIQMNWGMFCRVQLCSNFSNGYRYRLLNNIFFPTRKRLTDALIFICICHWLISTRSSYFLKIFIMFYKRSSTVSKS